MKITVICDVLGQPNNGTTIATLNLIRYLRKKGHEVTVVSSDEETDGEKNHFVVRKMNFGPLNNILERNGVSGTYSISVFLRFNGGKTCKKNAQASYRELSLPG